MKKIVILGVLFLSCVSLPTFSACKIENLGACKADIGNVINSSLQDKIMPNNLERIKQPHNSFRCPTNNILCEMFFHQIQHTPCLHSQQHYNSNILSKSSILPYPKQREGIWQTKSGGFCSAAVSAKPQQSAFSTLSKRREALSAPDPPVRSRHSGHACA